MNILTGTDIIEIDRIKKSIDQLGEQFRNSIFTEKEIEYCEKKHNAKYQHYAARFASKEAVYKAISRLLKTKYEVSWKDIQILNEESGKPFVEFTNKDIEKYIESIDISISHCKEYAVASVVLVLK